MLTAASRKLSARFDLNVLRTLPVLLLGTVLGTGCASALPAAGVGTAQVTTNAAVVEVSSAMDEACTVKGDAESCLAVGRIRLATGAADAAARALPYFERACANGSEEACWRGGEAAKSTDRGRAEALLRAGCRADASTNFGKSCCYVLATTRARSGEVDDLKASLPTFDGLCQRDYRPACGAKTLVEDALKQAGATEPLASR